MERGFGFKHRYPHLMTGNRDISKWEPGIVRLGSRQGYPGPPRKAQSLSAQSDAADEVDFPAAVTSRKALVSVFDMAFSTADGVYETIHSLRSQIFLRDQRLARCDAPATGIGLSIPQLNWPSVLPETMALGSVGD